MSSTKRVQEAIQEIKKGNMIIMLDDENRENEGDLVYAGTFSTAQKVNFLATHAKGLICVTVKSTTANRLELNHMVTQNNSSYQTAFTVSVDCKKATTGISAKERDDTIKILSNPRSKPSELVRPGHIFPLIAKDGGVLERTGHTEGSTDICMLSGIKEIAVICEIMKEDGTMARRDDLDIFAKKHNIKQLYISDIVSYRLSNESLIEQTNETKQTFFGIDVIKKSFKDHLSNNHEVIIFGKIGKIVNVRFHPVSFDKELLEDKQKFDYMANSIKYLQANTGLLIFMDHNQQANDIKKDFGLGAGILKKLNITNINLLVSQKIEHIFKAIDGFGIIIDSEVVVKQ
ncbi:MAG: bifunctional 3,4-dihydroxy-2-butanone 4-phosphate synthase/GTP cyclohydrolase II [Epsilonproteobacteria bacterium]|nr:MAG: bifunctional 3,4-dihydroxy-2-butanone 4-phosphate synthase/GTP cyclohydrolase II [Campylobacterota bacterium]